MCMDTKSENINTDFEISLNVSSETCFSQAINLRVLKARDVIVSGFFYLKTRS